MACYPGDAVYGSDCSDEEDEPCFVGYEPEVWTVLSADFIDLGDCVTDTAYIQGFAGVAPTAMVEFYVSTPSVPAFTQFDSQPFIATADPAVWEATSSQYCPTETGQHWFKACYPGDAVYGSDCSGDEEEPLDVGGEDQGCTPGFWKKNPKDGSQILPKDDMPDWPGGYLATDDLIATFSLDMFWDDYFGGDTLLDALYYGGGAGFLGMARNLMRHAVAALLNAAHPDISYHIGSTGGVIAAVQDVLITQRPSEPFSPLDIMTWRNAIGDLKNDFDDWNNAGCSINAHGDPCDGECD
jgi:hypothetical protein